MNDSSPSRSSLPSVYASEDYLVQLLAKAVAAKASDIHLKVGQPPGARIRGEHRLLPRRARCARGHRSTSRRTSSATTRVAAAARHLTRVRRRVLGEGRRALPREHLPAARDARDRDARRSRSSSRRSRSSAAPTACLALCREGARARARRRRGGQRQELDARRDDRPPEPHAAAPHRHHRGPDRVPPPRRQGERQPARGRASTRTASPTRSAPRFARTPTSSSSARSATR